MAVPGDSDSTLCILGCGNLGTAILKALVRTLREDPDKLPFDDLIACVRSERAEARLENEFHNTPDLVTVYRGRVVEAAQKAKIVILGTDPADLAEVLELPGLTQALQGKLLISIAAGWTRKDLETTLGLHDHAGETGTIWVVRTLPNINALVSESVTAIEEPDADIPPALVTAVEAIFGQVGRTVRVTPQLMAASTAVGGSTPAFFAVICDAFIDAAVAVGMPRTTAQQMIYQSMRGTAAMLQSGVHPGVLKDQGTSPEGCTIGGLMVLEEAAVRGNLGRALREAVTIARLMGTAATPHVNDTRSSG